MSSLLESLRNKIMGKSGNSGQLLTKQQRAKARQQYEDKLRKQNIAKHRQEEEGRWRKNIFITRFDNERERCSSVYPSSISDYECDILPHPDISGKSPEEVEAIYYEYVRLINDYKAQQQRKKQQQQRKKKQQQQRKKKQQQQQSKASAKTNI